MPLSESELNRYQRQLLIDGWDQAKLKNSRVLIVGLGGLGGVTATFLAAAGIGHLRLCDSDIVELSNLNRQILFSNEDIARPKAIIARRKLSALNPDIEIEYSTDKLAEVSAAKLAFGCNVVIDGLDNHKDRLILNRICFDLKVPFVYGAINEWLGQTSFFAPPKTPCLACLLPDDVGSPGPTPVFGALPAVIGSIQATSVIRYLLTGEPPLSGKLLIYHADTMAFETVEYDKNPRCPVCGRRQSRNRQP
jgi:molybdopterin/thiamine biosynthesis adenylyltransferase